MSLGCKHPVFPTSNPTTLTRNLNCLKAVPSLMLQKGEEARCTKTSQRLTLPQEFRIGAVCCKIPFEMMLFLFFVLLTSAEISHQSDSQGQSPWILERGVYLLTCFQTGTSWMVKSYQDFTLCSANKCQCTYKPLLSQCTPLEMQVASFMYIIASLYRKGFHTLGRGWRTSRHFALDSVAQGMGTGTRMTQQNISHPQQRDCCRPHQPFMLLFVLFITFCLQTSIRNYPSGSCPAGPDTSVRHNTERGWHLASHVPKDTMMSC